jgi:hypothetical protein
VSVCALPKNACWRARSQLPIRVPDIQCGRRSRAMRSACDSTYLMLSLSTYFGSATLLFALLLGCSSGPAASNCKPTSASAISSTEACAFATTADPSHCGGCALSESCTLSIDYRNAFSALNPSYSPPSTVSRDGGGLSALADAGSTPACPSWTGTVAIECMQTCPQ